MRYRLSIRSCRSMAALAFTASIWSNLAAASPPTYETSTGAYPDLQSKRIASLDSRSISSFNKICRDKNADNGEYDRVAQLLRDAIETEFGVSLPVATLSALNDNQDQIVIGDPSQPAIAALAEALSRSIFDLGPQGYNLVAIPNPSSSNGSWVVLLIAQDGTGVRNGALALVDLIANAGGQVEDLRVRDYPDYELRHLMHRLPPIPSTYDAQTVAEWVQAQRVSFQTITGRGINGLEFGRTDFWKLDKVTKDGTTVAQRMAEVAYWCRYYGMEPIFSIESPLPNADPNWREGAYVKDEPFLIESDLSLRPLRAVVDNRALNLDLVDGDGATPEFALGWAQSGSSSSDWQWVSGPQGFQLTFTGTGPKYLRTDEWDISTFEPGSFYVLEGHFPLVQGGIDQSGKFQPLWLGIYGIPATGPSVTFFHDFLRNGIDVVEDYYFWTPPSTEQVSSDPRYAGYSGPTFEEFARVKIQFYTLDSWTPDASHPPISVQIDNLFLERRNGALRNVMRTQATSDNLTFVVTSNEPDPLLRTTYVESADYELDHLACPWYYMPTKRYSTGNPPEEYVSSVQWQHTEDIGSTVLLSYTAGVPDDWNPGQQARTWCLKSPEFRSATKDLLRYLFIPQQIDPHGTGTSFSYAVNPKFLGLQLSEFRGANRCGRCVGAGDENGVYFANYVSSVAISNLDALASEGLIDAASVDIIVNGSFTPGSINGADSPGERDDYQFEFGGPYGDMAFRNAALAAFAGTSRRVIFPIGNGNCKKLNGPCDCNAWEYAARAPQVGWPYNFGPPSNVFVMAGNNPDVGATPEHVVTGEGCFDASTWLLPDVVGFSSVDPGYDGIHDDSELRLMDYGWRRHSNPDATLEVRLGGDYLTNDDQPDAVEVTAPTTYTFLPYGGPELRDPATSDHVITSASIDWDTGQAPVDVLAQLNTGMLTRSYWRNAHTATLTVVSEPVGGGTPTSRSVGVTFIGPQDPPPPPPTGKSAIPVAFGIHSVGANPSRASARIEFGLARAAATRLEVFDLRGRRVRSLLAASPLGPGTHVVEWDGKDSSGQTVANGNYVLQLTSGEDSQVRKLVLLR